MTVADKLRIKHRHAPRAPGRCSRRRMRRAHDPPCLGRRWLGLRCHSQQQPGDTRSLRGERQFAAGCEVELSRPAPDFQHDGANRIAGQRVGSRAQCTFDIGRAHGHDKARIETEFGEPAHRHRARFNLGEILPYPYPGPPASRPPCEGSHKAGRGCALPAGLGKYFVHGSQSEPALQRRVGIRMPERHPARRISLAMRLDALDTAAQSRKRARVRALSHTQAPRRPRDRFRLLSEITRSRLICS
jgi:hypothetical protein